MQQKAVNYLINTLDMIRSASSQMGTVLCVDFSHLPVTMVRRFHPDMRQVVKEKTWGNSILNLIITNLHSFYKPSTALPPLGFSDHKCLLLSHNMQSVQRTGTKWKMGRLRGPEKKQALAWCSASTDWIPVYEAENNDNKVEILNST